MRTDTPRPRPHAVPSPLAYPVRRPWSARRRLGLLGAVALAAIMAPFQVLAQNPSYSVSIVPQFSPAIVTERWLPLLQALERSTGLTLTLRYYKTIPEFEQAFEAGEPDFAFMNSYHAVMARKTQGYLPMVRDSEELLRGLLLVQKDSPVKHLRELTGQRVGFPAPNALGASLYLRALLAQQDVAVVPVYLGTHGNAYRALASGQVAAVGGIYVTWRQERPDLRDQMRVLYETPAVAPHPFSAHPRVPTAHRDAVQQALLQLANSEVGLQMLRSTTLSVPVAADYERDYAPLERLGLERFVVRQ